jgi:hypothetical protein
VLSAPERPPLAWLPVGAVAAGITTVLLVSAGGYDYHRDELYFRVLGMHPAWGYVDQPPFTPLLARLCIELFGDTVWAIRIPEAIIIGIAAILAAFIAREVGGGWGAQTLAALGLAAAFPLIAGHTILTATPDLIAWLLVILFAMRALLRERPKYWLGVGLTSGLALYNKHLVILLLLTLGVALLLVGPRRVLASPWVWAGMAIAAVVGSPNLVYQITHDFPQLKMAEALAENKGDDARITMLPLQVIMLGVPCVPIWIAGIVTLLRDRRLRPIRALAVAYPLMILLLLVIAGQPYYSIGLLLALFAIGCAPTTRWLDGHRGRQALVGAGVVVNVATSVVIALPVVPLTSLGDTVIPEINQVARDQIGWPTYVRQIADVYTALPAEDRARAVIVTGNYGEHGAVDRFGGEYGLPKVYSGQNELYHLGPPPDSATVVVFVLQEPNLARLGQSFNNCTVEGRLHNDVGVDNEEEVAEIVVCRGPRDSWAVLWPRFQHYD